MNKLELIESRHSVRQYHVKSIEIQKREILDSLIKEYNKEANIKIQSFYDEPTAFNTFMAHYGKFKGVTNYIALVGNKDKDEILGFYGEKLVLKAQELGLNSCWVALTYGKGKVKINKDKDEKLHCVIAIGYGLTNGVKRRSKKKEDVLTLIGEEPVWLDDAVKACLLAPTAINQQKFEIICENGNVDIRRKGFGFYADIDLGIIKCHFHEITGIKVK